MSKQKKEPYKLNKNTEQPIQSPEYQIAGKVIQDLLEHVFNEGSQIEFHAAEYWGDSYLETLENKLPVYKLEYDGGPVSIGFDLEAPMERTGEESRFSWFEDDMLPTNIVANLNRFCKDIAVNGRVSLNKDFQESPFSGPNYIININWGDARKRNLIPFNYIEKYSFYNVTFKHEA